MQPRLFICLSLVLVRLCLTPVVCLSPAVAIALCPWSQAYAQTAAPILSPNQDKLQQALRHKGLRSAQVGFVARRLDTGEEVFGQNSHVLLIPASNVKIITSAAALSILGADYQFKTDFLGTLDTSGNLPGHLTVVGYGDPYLLPERLSYLSARLRYMGVQHVGGDLVVDDSYFAATTRMALGWQEDRTSHAYMAPSGALSVGFNALMVHVLPGAYDGAPARVMVDPLQDYAKILGQVRTVGKGQSYISVEVMPRGAQSIVQVAGHIAQGDGPRAYWRRIDNPPLFAGEVLRQALHKEGITVAGRVRVGKADPSSPVLLTALSPRLAELLGPLNKYSNNFMAMQIALALGAHQYGAPATWDKASRALSEFLANKVGIAKGSYLLSNASGLHSVNRFTAEHIAQVLQVMHEDAKVGPEFITSLAVAAGSGTLQDRMMAGPAAHLVRAKTGTLAKASALSGYVTTAQGVPLVFSMLVNNYRHIAEVWAAQDAVAEAVAELHFEPSVHGQTPTQAIGNTTVAEDR